MGDSAPSPPSLLIEDGDGCSFTCQFSYCPATAWKSKDRLLRNHRALDTSCQLVCGGPLRSQSPATTSSSCREQTHNKSTAFTPKTAEPRFGPVDIFYAHFYTKNAV